MELADLGWNPFFEQQFAELAGQSLVPARVGREHKHIYALYTEEGELSGEVSGKFRHDARSRDGFPTVGDWVAVSARLEEGKATIHVLLERKSKFSRKMAGNNTGEQVVAANVDTIFLVSGLDGDFNLRRVERYVTLAWDSGAKPVIVLNKADLCDNISERLAQVESVAFGVPVLPVSAENNTGMEAFDEYLQEGKTIAFLGSSGVGKSSIVNRLVGTERQHVKEVREDDSRGRHTTTYRELIPLPNGALVIDTPGMRELQMWTDEGGLEHSFSDIHELAEHCRFGDCSHQREPGCSVREAIENGELDHKRFKGYLKLQREVKRLERRQSQLGRQQERAEGKKFGKMVKRMTKNHHKRLQG
ncbi:ribosome small subunit-dependent GTPase A [Candidatus Hydrogenedentota bacterium]